MSPLARAWLRRIAMGLPLTVAPVGVGLFLSNIACSCPPDYTHTFAIDASQAATILDAQGVATVSGCRAVCEALQNPGDAGLIDGAAPDTGPYVEREWGTAFGCHVVSVASTLEVLCEYHSNCPGGRRPSGLQSWANTGRVASTGEWLARMAWMEAASVDAFLELAADLRAHGAPDALAREAVRAAGDERRHASTIERLARVRGVVAPAPSRAAHARPTLEALAQDNAAEGGVRETFGALLASMQSELAPDADVRRAMRSIARDEARHAMLSADIDDWARTRVEGALLDRARSDAARGLAASLDLEHDAALATALGLPSLVVQQAMVRALV